MPPSPGGRGKGEGELTAWSRMPKPKSHFISPAILERARDFRHPLKPPEAKVWLAVRNRQLGFKFRRQNPIGRFIVDFWCAEARLVIEIDGDTHSVPDQAAYDRARTVWLEERGHKVIRFRAGQVERNIEGVLETIRRECEKRMRQMSEEPSG